MTTETVLEAKGSKTAHYDTDGRPACGTAGEFLVRRVASAAAFVTCSKCRKAAGQVYMVGPSGKPEFNTGRRVFGR